MTCSECGKESNTLYMCDLAPGEYCAECFNQLGCEVEHDEGCMTVVSCDD